MAPHARIPKPIMLFPPELTDDEQAWVRKHMALADPEQQVEFGDIRTWTPQPPPGPGGAGTCGP